MYRLFCVSVMGLFLSIAILAPSAAAQRNATTLAYQLTHVDTGEPFPSPDGKHLVFEITVEGFEQIFTMNRDGSGQKQITRDAANHDTPSWSPDGKKLAFASDKNGHSVIYMMNIDGTEMERLTDENAESIHPNWSPDSSKVIYCADDDLHPPKKNEAAIYSVDVKTKQVATLISGGTNTYPSWSPDGKRIVFRKMIAEINSEVFIANSDGSEVTNLTNHPAFDGWPAWSPNGTKIAFASNRNSSYQIFTMNPDGTGVQLIANTEGRATEPRWSIDGKMIYFTNCRRVDWGTDCQIFAAELGEKVPGPPTSAH